MRDLGHPHLCGCLLVLQMDRHVRSWAANVDLGFEERRSDKANVRIVGEAEAFLGNSKHVAVQLRIAVLVVNGGDGVIARWQMRPYRGRGAAGRVNWRRPGTICLGGVFRPSIRRREDDRAQIAVGVAESIYVNAQGAAGGGGFSSGMLRRGVWSGRR